MFDTLSDRFDGIFKRLRGRGKLTPADVDEVAREIRLALLEADVNVRVVKQVIARIKERAVGADVAQSLSPGQQVIKIVHEELVTTLGGDAAKLTMSSRPPTVILLAGLQGSGKTTAAAKLARYLERDGKRVLLVGADLQRPAAVEQLKVLGERVGVPVASIGTDPVSVAKAGVEEAHRLGRNVVIVDTAGRLHTKVNLMNELEKLKRIVERTPGALQEVLLVLDASTGQNGLTQAREFAGAVDITGVVLTKLDGTAKGGVVLAIEAEFGVPVKLVGLGEGPDDLVAFEPSEFAAALVE